MHHDLRLLASQVKVVAHTQPKSLHLVGLVVVVIEAGGDRLGEEFNCLVGLYLSD